MLEARRAREKAATDADGEIARGERETLRKEHPDIRSIVGAPRKVVLPKREAPRGTRPRWAIPAVVAAVLLIAGTAVGGVFYVRGHETTHRPATPAAPAARSAAGTVVPGAFTPPPAPRPDSVAAPAGVAPPVDTSASKPRRDDSVRDDGAPPKRRVIDRPATEATAPAPVAAPIHDSTRPDSVWARTDSVARADSLRRESAGRDTSRPDAAYGRDTSRQPDTSRQNVVRVDTTWLDGGRREAARRDSLAKRDSAIRDTTRVRPDSTGRIPPM
jgi:hypothetical protein